MKYLKKDGNLIYNGKKSKFCYQPDRDVWVGFGKGFTQGEQKAFCEIIYEHIHEEYFMQTFDDAALSTLILCEIVELMRELGKRETVKVGKE